MYEMIAYCGLNCEECPAYEATQRDDMEKLAQVAAEWSKGFGMEIPKEAILCDSCKSDTGRICAYCSVCQVAACAKGKGLPTCGHCEEYICDKLESLPAFSDDARGNLDGIRDTL